MSRHATTIESMDQFVEPPPPRWNSWFRVSPVQFEGEDRAIPRGVRLCCPAVRAGDPVQIIEAHRITSGRLLRIECSILHVAVSANESARPPDRESGGHCGIGSD